jgi:DNA-binding FadR family transcriptional regulator
MPRKSLVDVVADELLDQIVAGDLAVGDALPTEAELGEKFEVSRVTVREALRALSSRGIVRVMSGIGSVVAPLSQWQSLDAILRYTSARGDDGDVALQLIAVRRMFETEAASWAATRLVATDLTELASALALMEDAHARADVAAFVAADLRFHDIILRGAGNVFLAALFRPLASVLAERRAETSRVPEIQDHAIVEHRAVLQALRARDADGARRSMDHHMQQTLDDLRKYVLQKSGSRTG